MNAFVRTPPIAEAVEVREGSAAVEWLQLALGVVAAIAAVVLVITGVLNRSLQADVAAGQARIASAQTAATVNADLIRLLAKAAAEKGDSQIRDLLARNGITYSAATPASPAAEGAKP